MFERRWPVTSERRPTTTDRPPYAHPRLWVIERTTGWLMHHRRLARDYETLSASSEAIIHLEHDRPLPGGFPA